MKENFKPEIVYHKRSESPGSGPWDELKDSELVSRALSGDDRAFEALMNRYNPMIVWYLYGKTNSESDTEDLAQEIFLLAYKALGSLHKKNKFFPWLMQIAKRRLLSYYRYLNRRPTLVVPQNPNKDQTNHYLDYTPDQKASPREQAYHREFRNALSREIAGMKKEHQLVLEIAIEHLQYLCGLKEVVFQEMNNIYLNVMKSQIIMIILE